MLTFLKKLLWDETAFVRYSRAVLLGLGAAIAANELNIPGVPDAWGIAVVSIGGLLGAGDKNTTKEG